MFLQLAAFAVCWHIDGAWHLHFLGRVVEEKNREVKPDLASIALLVWNRTLPYGGMTGLICGSHKNNLRTIIAADRYGGISNLMILIRQSLFGGAAVDPVADTAGEKVLHAGDAIFMHSHLTHSSAWNYQPCLRLGTHRKFSYKEPMDMGSILQMGRRQSLSKRGEDPLPSNTELLLEALGN